jgi:enterochelin esterase-like enzyme
MAAFASRLIAAALASLLSGVVAAQMTADGGHVSLGVVVGAADPCNIKPRPEPGALVLGVRPGGGADRAGIKASDILLRFGSTDIKSYTDLMAAVREAHVGDRDDIVLKRGDRELTQPFQFAQTDVLAPTAGWSSAPGPGPTPAVTAPGTSPVPPMTGCLSEPYSVLPLPADAARRAAALVTDSSISLEDEVLTIVHRDSAEKVQLLGSIQLPMTRVPGTQVWLTQLKMAGWRRMFFSYQFITVNSPNQPAEFGIFRGADAPELLTPTSRLKGRLIHTHLHSQLLNADRDVSLYLPPDMVHGLPVLFMTDGQSVESFAKVLEPLMLNHRIRQFAIVGELAAQNPDASAAFDPQKDMRSREYLPEIDKDTFERHLRFFTAELMPWASHKYGVSARRAERALFGFSSGGAFALHMAVVHPELYAAVLPFSVGVSIGTIAPTPNWPRIYLAAGELEPPFLATTRQAQAQLHEAGAEATFTSYPSGHDIVMWELALVNYLPSVFPPQQ